MALARDVKGTGIDAAAACGGARRRAGAFAGSIAGDARAGVPAARRRRQRHPVDGDVSARRRSCAPAARPASTSLVTPLLSHADVEAPTSAGDAWRLVRFWEQALAAADRTGPAVHASRLPLVRPRWPAGGPRLASWVGPLSSGFRCSHEPGDFRRREIAQLAGLQARVADRSDADAAQAIDGMRDRVAHLAHLPIAAFANRDLDDACWPRSPPETRTARDAPRAASGVRRSSTPRAADRDRARPARRRRCASYVRSSS